MGLPDPHDPRTFQLYAKFAADGTVAAMVEVADGQPEPDDHAESVYINVTDLHPIELSGVTASPADVVSARTAGRASPNPQPPAENPGVIVPVVPVPPMSARARTARRALRVVLETAKETQTRRG